MYTTSSRGLGYDMDIPIIRMFVIQPKMPKKISNPFSNKMKKERGVHHELLRVRIRDEYSDYSNVCHHPKIYPTLSKYFAFWLSPSNSFLNERCFILRRCKIKPRPHMCEWDKKHFPTNVDTRNPFCCDANAHSSNWFK